MVQKKAKIKQNIISKQSFHKVSYTAIPEQKQNNSEGITQLRLSPFPFIAKA